MDTKMKFFNVLVILFMTFTVSGCGHYYHYGLHKDLSVIPQDKDQPVTGDYEFQSIVFVSDDGNLTISLQHPVHPIVEPDVFKSQVGITLHDPQGANLEIHSVEFNHKDSQSNIIEPIHTKDYHLKPLEHRKSTHYFYTRQYSRTTLTTAGKTLTETAVIDFTYNGKHHTVVFNETVKKAKRWSKFSVMLMM